MHPFSLVRPALFAIEPERAHRLTIAALKRLPRLPQHATPSLAVRLAGIDFPNPVGLAAGVDKDAEAPDAFLSLGFGFAEVGTLTPLPQAGNPRPRLFRLVEDRGVINRLGFNNGGQAAALARLQARQGRAGIVGVNIGANKDSADRIADYVTGVRTMTSVASYLTVNISSPNTPGLRDLQGAGALDDLLAAIGEARAPGGPPIFLKVAPDLAKAEIESVVRVAIRRGADALIMGNTTVTRPGLASPHREEIGGLSGAPLRDLALSKLRDLARVSGGTIPLIAAGGIASGAEVRARMRAGASLVQLYSSLIYHGPGLARRINSELRTLLKADGYQSVMEWIGADTN